MVLLFQLAAGALHATMNHGHQRQIIHSATRPMRTSRPIVTLVNRAFAVEKFFKSGERTDETQIREMMQHGPFLLLTHAGNLIACVYVKPNAERVYIGMLAVDPAPTEIGYRLAHDACRPRTSVAALECKFADIRVVSVRPELPLIYGKLGYVPTGEESAAVIKSATMPVHFVTMSKPL